MLKKEKQLSRPLISKTLVYIVTIIIVFDLMMVIGFVRYSDKAARAAQTHDNINTLIDILDIARVSNAKNQSRILSIFTHPNIHMTITKKPIFQSFHLQDKSLWEVYDFLKKNYKNPLNFSYHLRENAWLNIAVEPVAEFSVAGLILIAIALFMTFIIISYAWAVDRFTQSINHMTQRASMLGMQSMTEKIPIYGPNMVRRAIRAMNELQTRVHQLTQERITTIAALSHDIKTPLTRLKLRMQLAMPETEQEKCLQDFSEIETLLKDTLYYASEQHRQESLQKFDLVSLLQSMVDDLAELGKNILFETNATKAICKGQLRNLKRAFGNIISNSFNYADQVSVSLMVENAKAIIKLSDNGPGLPEHDLEKVFEAFYRGESSRSRETGGVGLGLAITKKIIQQHQGIITLNNSQQGGLTAVIELPLAQ